MILNIAYFGPELLSDLQAYYKPRLKSAIERGYTEPGSQYHWLFEELRCRILTLDQALRVIDALPKFMTTSTEEQIFHYVINYTTSLFKQEAVNGIERDEQDKHPYFNEANPYWIQMNEVFDAMGVNYDTSLLPVLYIDLSEYVVRSVRLYLQIREKTIHAIDRGKFDQLMKVSGALVSSA